MSKLEFKTLGEDEQKLLESLSTTIKSDPRNEFAYKVYRGYRDEYILQGFNPNEIEVYDLIVRGARG